MMIKKPIPVIDLFAGPGGLGEGFSSLIGENKSPLFSLKVSAEKDHTAHQTLSLRALYRKFQGGRAPDCYYDHVRGDITRGQLFTHRDAAEAGREALEEARNFELGKNDPLELDARIRHALSGEENWVLIGGPPCQAYSVVGRSRRTRESQEKFESDERHFLYQEYLRIIRIHRPAVFVMENVKGMLSSKHGGSPIFDRIISDLSSPETNLEYEIHSLVKPGGISELDPYDFLIEAERFGIPQGRHRVILFGIRSDIAKSVPKLGSPTNPFVLCESDSILSVGEMLSDLPPLRSRLSREADGHESWLGALNEAVKVLKNYVTPDLEATFKEMQLATVMAAEHQETGGAFIPKKNLKIGVNNSLTGWFIDERLGGVIQHETRSHMRKDLQRYIFAAAYAKAKMMSPRVTEFPIPLLPDHLNVFNDKVPFIDRFRVQIEGIPSSTIVSHIAKDGHYFIHYDPSQCRSLTVREAARLQTFPDNYFFAGKRTEQYTQVGNAVPPLLARKIALVVADFMEESNQNRARPLNLGLQT